MKLHNGKSKNEQQDDNVLETAQLDYKQILIGLGWDVNAEGLKRTPERHIKFLAEFSQPEKFNFTTFEAQTDQMVIQKEIPFYSLCEHHVIPFFGTAAVAYIPNERIVGLSKLARSVDYFARLLQNQERITEQVADFINEHLEPKGVAVSLVARHLCMEMRGVQKSGSYTRTTAFRGEFKSNGEAKSEFLNQLTDKT